MITKTDKKELKLMAAAPALQQAVADLLEEHDAIEGANPCEMTWDKAREALAASGYESEHAEPV